MRNKSKLKGWRLTLHKVIFEADTKAGKAFDIALILIIAFSTLVVMLESVNSIKQSYGNILRSIEWTVTILFTVEYVLRIICVGNPLKYITSFFGVVDLMAVLPTYLSIFIPGSQYLTVVRALRILRVFRVLKLALYLHEGDLIIQALKASRRKITVFLFAVLNMIVILGSIMYLIEGEANGFTSIPRGIYWAIVTLTTVGYGDIAPQTGLGQFFSAIVMILGYSIIAVPTGIVTVEIANKMREPVSAQVCQLCSQEGHDKDSLFCKYCGEEL